MNNNLNKMFIMNGKNVLTKKNKNELNTYIKKYNDLRLKNTAKKYKTQFRKWYYEKTKENRVDKKLEISKY